MKKLSLFLLFSIICLATFAQNSFTITGKIIDSNTKVPLQGASVFAQNTTFGVATDEGGNFRLKLPAGGYDLVVTFTGYETESIRISNASGEDKNLVIEIRPREKSMEEVSIIVSNEVEDGWNKYGQFFRDNFIGKSAFGQQCTILNPEVLKFYFSKKRNRLKVLAPEPLLIKNNALGYNIKYTIDSFVYEYNNNTAFFIGYPLFEEMLGTASQGAEWLANREKAYKGSLLHFMRSFYRRILEKEGFEVQFIVRKNDHEASIPLKNVYGAMNYQRDDSLNIVEFNPNQPELAVIYKNDRPEQIYLDQFDTKANKNSQVSLMTIVPKETITIEENGYYYEQTDLTLNGYWGFKKAGDMVPYDYASGN